MADEKSADKLMKQAEKCIRPAVMSMRFKPDWDEAYPLFEKAAVQYRVRNAARTLHVAAAVLGGSDCQRWSTTRARQEGILDLRSAVRA